MDKSDVYMLLGTLWTLIVGLAPWIEPKAKEWKANRHKRKARRRPGRHRKRGKHRRG